MKRKFSTRENVLIVILAVLLLACLYYLAVDQPVRNTIQDAQERQANAQTELEIENVRLTKLHAMQDELATLDSSAEADVPDYDNAQNVVSLLNQALSQAEDYELTFQSVEKDGAIASRTIDMSFTCDGYDTARDILSTLTGSYRCRVTSLVVTGDSNVRADSVTVRLTVVFYEYLSPDQRTADTTDGTEASDAG